MTQDEPNAEDLVINEAGISFICDKQVQQLNKKINIDYSEFGWKKGFVIYLGDSYKSC